jgi:membrane protein required for colicin V production
MSALDWIFLTVLLGSLALGAWRGFVHEVLSVVNWLLAFCVAHWLGADAGQYLPLGAASEVVRFAVGFVLVFVLVAMVGGLLVWGVTRLVESSGLKRVDRALGAGFGVLRGVILLLAVTVVMAMTPLKTSTWWRNSTGAGISMSALKWLKPILPEGLGKYLP